MINLRYHIVSISAVFLALGIGLTLGTTFLDRVTVDNLKGQLDDLEREINATNAENARLDDRLDSLDDESTALLEQRPERLFDGALEGAPVLIVAPRGTNEDVVERSVNALGSAGAEVSGVWWFTDRFALDDADEAADLADVLAIDPDDVDRLRVAAINRISAVLEARVIDVPDLDSDETTTTTLPDGTPPTDAADEPAVLAALHDAGFVDYDVPADADADRVILPNDGLRVLVIGDIDAQSAPSTAVDALLRSMTASEAPAAVVVGGTTAERDPDVEDPQPTLVELVRDDEALRDFVSSIDDVDHAAGLAAMVLALVDLDAGRLGHYGVGDGAARLLPAPAPA